MFKARKFTAIALSLAVAGAAVTSRASAQTSDEIVGVWASADGRLRIEFTATGQFVEDYNGRRAAYAGSYVVEGATFTLHERTGIVVRGTIAPGRITLSGFDLTKQQ